MHNLSLSAVCRSCTEAGARWRPILPILLLATILSTLLTACSSGGSGNPGAGTSGDDLLSDPQAPSVLAGQPQALQQLADDPGLLVELPEVLSTFVTAEAGVQVAYTGEGQNVRVPALTVESQWQYMQQCLQLTGVAPLVLVRTDEVTPFTLSDDVIFDIEGIPVASGSRRDIPVLQIREDEFELSLSNPGFNLRSIMGRVLWLSAGLAERDYPFTCAQGQPDADVAAIMISR